MKSRLVQIFKRSYINPEDLLFQKKDMAEEIFTHWKEHFTAQREFIELLKNYEEAVKYSNKLMENFKSFNECYKCSVLEKKGCCKAGLENEVTINIILINLFLEKDLPTEREIAGRCFFVGSKGCKIFARPYLCREFFCRRLLNTFNEEEYQKISVAIAEELTLLYKLCEYIKRELNFLLGEFIYELDITGYS